MFNVFAQINRHVIAVLERVASETDDDRVSTSVARSNQSGLVVGSGQETGGRGRG